MSHYKSALRTQPPAEAFAFRNELAQLQELFPNWTADDLQSLLLEVAGDVQVAATRITDGVALPWGEVSRKKDKKGSIQPSKVPRGDSLGGRGGRGGRGGVGRGGASARGRGGRGGANGHGLRSDNAHSSSPAPLNGSVADVIKAGYADLPAKPVTIDDHHNGITPSSSGWTEESSQPETSTSTSSVSSPWPANGAQILSPKPVVKPPAKLSWAQIAGKPQEKPAPPQPPASLAPEHAVPEQEGLPLAQEEPTTAQAPVWDDEPTPAPSDAWGATDLVADDAELEAVEEFTPEPEPESEPALAAPEPVREEEPPAPVKVASPAPVQAIVHTHAPVTPSPKLSRPATASHRSSARYKVTDQPVVMPSSFGTGIEKVGMQFGSLSLGGETISEPPSPEPEQQQPTPQQPEVPSPQKVQVKPQFEPVPPPPATAPASSTSLSSVFQQQQQAPAPQPPAAQTPTTHHAIPSSVSQPIQPTSHTSLQQYSQQQSTPQQQPSIASSHQQPHQNLPQQLQQSHHSYAQHNLSSQLETPPAQIQQPALQGTAHSNYFRQIDSSSAAPYFHTPTPPGGQDSSYGAFGQLSGQNQQSAHSPAGFTSTDYVYSDSQRHFYDSYPQQTTFGGRNALGHDDVKGLPGSQQQATATGLSPAAASQTSQQHSAAQSTAQAQQSANQGPQQGYAPPPIPPYYYSHPAFNPQNQYFGSPYNSGYGVPQPYVKYPMFQTGPPGPGSAPSPAAKQPGSNVGLQPQANPYNQALYQQVSGYDDYQPHPHHSQQQHQHSHGLSLGQGGVGGAGEYGKQLYGSSGQVGMQGFMGLGSQTGGGVTVPASATGGPRAANSPEAAYKPYGSKDVAGGGRGGGGSAQQQAQGQAQGQNQGQGQGGPQNQGFYGANRFTSGVGGGGGGGGPQQNAHHQPSAPQHLGYSQAANDGNFYQYQRQGQGGYWQ